jgi:N-sulfoglucosamine sulfohydrolase
MTTRGIINGSDAFGIRTVRDDRYRLVWNLHHKTEFKNACTKADSFQSMIAAAKAGDEKAGELVRRYQHRPEFELFDCEADPLEMENLASDPQHSPRVAQLFVKLTAWMKSQGDRGIETELNALLRQGKYKGMTREEAVLAWRKKTAGNGRKKKAGRDERAHFVCRSQSDGHSDVLDQAEVTEQRSDSDGRDTTTEKHRCP